MLATVFCLKLFLWNMLHMLQRLFCSRAGYIVDIYSLYRAFWSHFHSWSSLSGAGSLLVSDTVIIPSAPYTSLPVLPPAVVIDNHIYSRSAFLRQELRSKPPAPLTPCRAFTSAFTCPVPSARIPVFLYSLFLALHVP